MVQGFRSEGAQMISVNAGRTVCGVRLLWSMRGEVGKLAEAGCPANREGQEWGLSMNDGRGEERFAFEVNSGGST